MNRGNKPTFVTSTRQEVIDIKIATLHVGNYIKDWHATEEVSCSDHRYIRFTVMGIDHSVITYRNPHRTDWECGSTCMLWACLMGIQPADSAGWRLKQCSIVSVAVRR